jgi:hypothetical protein
MPPDPTKPVSPALKDAALLNLGWQPDHVVIDASSGELPPAPPNPVPSDTPVPSPASSDIVLSDTPVSSDTVQPDTPASSAPVAPGVRADWILFFGPFLQLTDVEIFRRLEAAKLLLKPDGRIVFSFLEYDAPHHWQLFRQSVGGARPPGMLDPTPEQSTEPTSEPSAVEADGEQPAPPQSAPFHFLNRGTIESWVLHLGLTLECHYSGEVRWLQPLQSGAVEATGFGQSVAVLAQVSAMD